jgi:hypothetical protein
MSEYYVECNPDEKLLQYFSVPSKAITHCKGSGNIFNRLQKNKGCFALIDEDPATVPHRYFNELTLQHNSNGIKVYTDKLRNNKIVVLSPRFEEWIITAAKESKVSMDDFNLSDNPRFLHSSISGRLTNLGKLLEKIDENKSSRLIEFKRHIAKTPY